MNQYWVLTDEWGQPVLKGPDGAAFRQPVLTVVSEGNRWGMQFSGEQAGWFTLTGGPWVARVRLVNGAGTAELSCQLRCTTPGARLDRLEWSASLVGSRYDRVWRTGADMIDYAGLLTPDQDIESYCTVGLTDTAGSHALVMGFGRLDQAWCRVRVSCRQERITALSAVVDYDGIPVTHEWLITPPLLLCAGESLWGCQTTVAEQMGRNHQARVSKPNAGWCSWYYYFGSETEQDILDAMGELAAAGWTETLPVIQIDDGWNKETPDSDRIWGDWFPGAKFPRGMKALADDIHHAGFQAGLWLAPFSVDPASRLRAEHPDWLVQAEDGPAEYWGVHALDLTHPDALAFVQTTFERVFDAWGFDYVKIDFLIHAVQPGRRYDPSQTRVQAFREGLKRIRLAAGDRYILTCGCPEGLAIGIADAQRIGPDVSSRWYVPMGLPHWPYGNCSVKPAAIYTLAKQWQHARWWQNDPDCVVVRAHGSPTESTLLEGDLAKGPYGLSDGEARLWARLVRMSGGLFLLSERLNDLEPARRELLADTLALEMRLVRRVDWYEHALCSAWITKDSNVTGLIVINLTDESVSVTVPCRALTGVSGCTLHCEETGVSVHVADDPVDFGVIPPRSLLTWRQRLTD